MRIVEQIGRTVEEAKEAALRDLGVSPDTPVEFEVLDEGSKGVFGLGIKYARVRAAAKVKEDFSELAEEMLTEILHLMQIGGVVEKEFSDGFARLNIVGADSGLLIGKHGQTLDSLQYLLNLMVSKRMGYKCRIVVDVEGYRVRRERSLREMALRMADKAVKDQKNVSLEPMLPNERRIVHLALQETPEVTTFSQGEEPLRRVVISPKKIASPVGGRQRTAYSGRSQAATSVAEAPESDEMPS